MNRKLFSKLTWLLLVPGLVIGGWHGYAFGRISTAGGLPTWQALGPHSATGEGMSESRVGAFRPSAAVDHHNRPVLAWVDVRAQIIGDDYPGLFVARWENNAWAPLGTSTLGVGVANPLQGVITARPAVAVDSHGQVYVAWWSASDGQQDGFLYLKYWDGTAWNDLGGSSVGSGLGHAWSPGLQFMVDLAIGTDDLPVVVFAGFQTDNSWRIYLKKWNGGAWVGLSGSDVQGLNAADPLSSALPFPSVAMCQGAPVVAWTQVHNSSRDLYVRQYDAGSGYWIGVGTGSAAAGGVSQDGAVAGGQVVAGAGGRPWVAWFSDAVHCAAFNGSQWISLGTVRNGYWPRLAWSSADSRMLCAFEADNEAYLAAWDGAQWTGIGGSLSPGGLSDNAGESIYPVVAVGATAEPVVAWQDNTSGKDQVYTLRYSTTAIPTPNPTPARDTRFVVDNRDAGFTTVGNWSTSAVSPDGYGPDYRALSTTDFGQATWQPTLPCAGLYQVSAWYSAGRNRTQEALYSVRHQYGVKSWTINQQSNGGRWVVLGNLYMEPSTARVQVEGATNAQGYVIADAVSFRFLSATGAWVVDDSDAQFTTTGQWVGGVAANDYGAGYHYASASGVSSSARWSFLPLVPGFYAVEAWYPAYSNAATDTPVSISDMHQHTLVRVDQTQGSGRWNLLQTLYLAQGQPVSVPASNSVSHGYVLADAIRWRYIDEPTRMTIVDENNRYACTAQGNWSVGTGNGAYGSAYLSHAAGNGSDFVLWRPFLPEPGFYQIAVCYPAGAGQAPDAKYIVGSGTEQDRVVLDQRQGGGSWRILGHYFLPAGRQAFVKLSDAASGGNVVADAIRFVYVAAPVADWVVDNQDSGTFGKFGNWQYTLSSASYSGLAYYLRPGSTTYGARALWLAPEPGPYLISLYYPPGTNRGSVALAFMGASGWQGFSLNQQVGYLRWVTVNVGGFYSGQELQSTYLLPSTTGYSIADAVRFTDPLP